ncbi:MAG TPA: AzlC family ABC transporter permease [Acidimicrobiales bacterium]
MTGAVPAPAAGRAHDLFAGARAMGPWLLGIAPYGLVIGISAAQAGIPALAGWLTGPLVFAGSAQVATIQLLDSGAAPLVVVIAALSVNLRLILYSATMAHHWAGTPRWWRAAAAYLIVDPSVAVGVDGYERTGDRRRGHLRYAGGAATLWLAWVGAITAGATVGTGLPAGLHLEYVVPLFLVGDVVPRLTGTAVRRGVAAAAVIAVAGRWIPLHLGALAAIAGGLAVALLTPEGDR